jgi:homeobox protein cut-like
MANFSGALATWKSISLSDLQITLDAQGFEVVQNQKESLVGRKALADRTKGLSDIYQYSPFSFPFYRIQENS